MGGPTQNWHDRTRTGVVVGDPPDDTSRPVDRRAADATITLWYRCDDCDAMICPVTSSPTLVIGYDAIFQHRRENNCQADFEIVETSP
jgi:hypothetical protein